MKIIYLYRSKNLNAHSVERMFGAVEPMIAKKTEVSSFYVPQFRVTPKNLYENYRYVKNVVRENPTTDVFHITGDIYYVALALPAEKTVLTILDTVTLQNSKGLRRLLLKWIWFTMPTRRCKYIQVISEKTKQEIVELYPGCEDKLKIIPCTADDAFTLSGRTFDKQNPIILHIGTKENKNLIRVIDAIEGLKCKLYIVGKLNSEQQERLKDKKINYINMYCVSDEEMVKLYQNCDIVTFPSLYEGFGSVPIEAQASGKPVITSNIEPMVSVSNGSSCQVDPLDVNSIRDGIIKIINDDEYRESLIQKGLENCKRFYPSVVAEQYMSLYNEIIKNNKQKEK